MNIFENIKTDTALNGKKVKLLSVLDNNKFIIIDVVSNKSWDCSKKEYLNILEEHGPKLDLDEREKRILLTLAIEKAANNSISSYVSDTEKSVEIALNRCKLIKALKENRAYEYIDNAVGHWHLSTSPVELHEFLGLSWDEYKVYIDKPSIFLEKLKGENV